MKFYTGRSMDKPLSNFPDGQSAVMLVAARLRHIAGKRVYLDMERLCDAKPAETELTMA